MLLSAVCCCISECLLTLPDPALKSVAHSIPTKGFDRFWLHNLTLGNYKRSILPTPKMVILCAIVKPRHDFIGANLKFSISDNTCAKLQNVAVFNQIIIHLSDFHTLEDACILSAYLRYIFTTLIFYIVCFSQSLGIADNHTIIYNALFAFIGNISWISSVLLPLSLSRY